MGLGRGSARRRIACIAVGVCALLVAIAGVASAAARDFEHPANHAPADAQQQFGLPATDPQRADTPNDPGYDIAEPDDPDSKLNGGPFDASTNIYDEDFGFFGFPSARTRLTALYTAGPNLATCAAKVILPCPQISGFNASGAWKLDRGRPDVVVAVLDTGIKWDRNGLRTQVHLNRGELPVPKKAGGSDCASYDCNGDGEFNVTDYANDPRVSLNGGPHGVAGQVDAEDLIAAFTDGTDADSNGFADDIAGWDFFDNDNDPYDASSYFAASNHGSGRMGEVAERGNDGEGSIGVCPHCQLLPIRTWDTFVSDGNDFGMGMIYATDNGASVIEGANGSTYHSAFAEQASQYAYDHGVVQTYSGDDLNTGNHNYAANYGHAMLIQGTVPDTMGLGQDAGNEAAQALAGICQGIQQLGCPGTSIPALTYFRGANTTQYGGKSSISMEGSTGSENTGKAAGAAGLVVSAARDASPAVTLRPDETREILEQTAERVLAPNTIGLGIPDPGADPTKPSIDQWTTHFGWGRVNLGAAVALAQSGKIPPEVAIDSPDWYAPVTGNSIEITGLARSRFAAGGSFNWKLEWGVGEAPTSWTTAKSGTSTGTVTDFGSIDLSKVRSAIASSTPPVDLAGPTLSPTSPSPFKNEFTVRVVANGAGISTPGVDRRVLTSAQDSSLRSGFPKRMGTGGEAPIRYADLDGDNTQELIVPTEDGAIHAYEPDGSELAGWPVHTRAQLSAAGHDSAPGFHALEAGGSPPREPLRGPVVADLNGDGVPEVVDSAGIHVYAFEPDGSALAGFPVTENLSFCNPANESQPLVHPKCGFLSSPTVGHLEGPGRPLDIVIPSLDGHLYAFDEKGNPLPGFPVQLVDPAVPPDKRMIAESINEPAIGDLNGDGKDDVVVATNEAYDAVQDPQQALSALLAGAAGGSSRVYAVHSDGTGHAGGPFLPGWPVKLDGAIQTTLPLIGPGQDPSIANIGGKPTVVASTTGSATIELYDTSGQIVRTINQAVYGAGSNATDRTGTINLFESASLGKLLPGAPLDVIKYGLSLSDVANLLLVGQNVPYNHLIGAYDSSTGAPLPSFPLITDDFQFLSSSDVAKVDSGSSTNQVVAGTGLGLLHAYDGASGLDAPGFPKVTGGWLFAPAAFSDDGRMADITREGYLFQWNLPKLPKCQTRVAQFRHDPRQSGNYDTDGTPPSTPTNLRVLSGEFVFSSPGDDYSCGTPAKYEIATSAKPITPQNFDQADAYAKTPTPVPGGNQVVFNPTSHRRYIAYRAVDDAGNVGYSAEIDTGSGPPPPGPGPGGRPNTKIKKLEASSRRHRVKARFAGSGGSGSPYRFECKLLHPKKRGNPKKPFHRCSSPYLHKHLKSGHYMLKVRAIDSARAKDSTPAKREFRIKRLHRHRHHH